jgi:D-alanyl-lipoteichoic acid acyltransferase DltB (MBOAT superfamily)
MSVSKERDSNVTPFLTYVGLIFCIINLALFYLWLLPNIGKSISEKCLSVWTCSRFLKKTWVGYTIDVADGQWRELRGNLWLLWICLIFTIVVKILLNYSTNRESITIAEIEYEKLGEKRFILQRIFRLIFACCFLAVQHKYHSLIIVTISILAFLLSKLLKGSKSSVYIIWVFGLLILFFKESYRIKNYPNFSFLQPLFDRRYGGIYKWQLPANFLILRLISFCLDYHRAFVYHEKKNAENEGDKIAVHYLGKPQEEETVAATKSDSTNKTSECLDSKVNNKRHFRDIIHLQLSDYNLLNFSVYAIYAPLYMAGPIITFNDFVTSSKNFKDQKLFPAFYLVRWLLCFAFMEFLSHQFPLFAVVNSGLFSNIQLILKLLKLCRLELSGTDLKDYAFLV